MADKIETTYTIQEFISMKESDEITYNKYSILQPSLSNEKITYSSDNVIYTYMDEIMMMKKKVTLSESDIRRYQYKPKLLSYDIYGSTESYFVILAMNGMCSAKDFNLIDKWIYALKPADFADIMSKIYNAEQQYLILNRASI